MSFRRYFQLRYSPVGVKLLEAEDGEVMDRFCSAVKEATNRRVIAKAFNCAGAEVSLFIEQPKEFEPQSILIEPYNEKGDYDVVLVVATPEKVMEISRAFKQVFGGALVARFSGSRAVCGEATADVIRAGKPNVSFLCEGARVLGGYSGEEVVVGFPAELFRRFERELVTGKLKALCGCLTDDLPEHVKKKFMAMGFDKATDHFMGYINGKIVSVYVFRGEVSDRIAIYTSLKFRSEEEAEKALEAFDDGEVIAYRREKWLEVSKVLKLEEDIARAVKRPEFERWFLGEVEGLVGFVKMKLDGFSR